MPTTTGPAYGRTAFSNERPTSPLAGKTSAAAPSAPAAAARLDPAENDWYAGIRDLPTGPLSRKDLSDKISAGDVNGETLVWREGYADWVPLRTVSSLKDLLPSPVRIVSSAPPPSPAPAREQHPSLGDEDEDDAVTRVSDAGAALLAAIEGSKPEAFNAEATMLDIAPVQRMADVSAKKAPEVELKKFDPESTMAEIPSAKLSSVGSLARKSSEPPLDTTIRETRHEAKPESHPPPARPSRVPPVAKESAVARHDPPREESRRASTPPVNAPTLSATPDVSRAKVSSAPPPPPSAPPPPPSVPPHAHSVPPHAPSVPPPAPPVASVAAALPNDAHLHEFEFPPLVSSPSLVPPVAVQERSSSRRGGLPGAVWVMAAGVLVVSVAGGIAISRKGAPQPIMNTANAATTAERRAPPPAPVAASAVVSPTLPGAETQEPAQAQSPTANTVDNADPEDPNPSSTHRHRSTHGRRDNELSAEDRRYLNAQLAGMAGMTGGGGGGPVVTTPSASTSARSSSATGGGANTAPDPPSRPRDTVRQQSVQQALERSGIVRRCWDQLLRRNPATELRRLPMTLHVNAEGTVTRIDVQDTSEPMMVSCIQMNTRSIRSVGEGSALDVQSTPRLDR